MRIFGIITGIFVLFVAAVLAAIVIIGLTIKPTPIVDITDDNFGAITTIQGTDRLTDSRTTINNNFTDLDTRKMEMSTTSVNSITTLSNLVSIGTITTGVWNGTVIDVARQGTGTTSPQQYHIMFGNGASGLGAEVDLGTSGQFLTSGGAGAFPSWTTGAVDTALDRTWTGHNIFTSMRLSAFATSSDLISASTTVGTLVATTSVKALDLTITDSCTGCHATSTWVGAMDFEDVDTTLALSNDMPAQSFADGTAHFASANVQVPKGATGISSIEVYYLREVDANLRMSYDMSHFKTQAGALPYTIQSDTTDPDTTTATGGAGNVIATLTVPAGAYDGLSDITEGDIISIEPLRNAGDAADTYNQAWIMYGVMFNWN